MGSLRLTALPNMDKLINTSKLPLSKTFNGEEHSIIELKRFFLLTLFNWMTALSSPYIPSFWEVLDLCYFT